MKSERKRMLYDVPLIPRPERTPEENSYLRTWYPEVRVIWQHRLLDVFEVKNRCCIGSGPEANVQIDKAIFPYDNPILIKKKNDRWMIVSFSSAAGSPLSPETIYRYDFGGISVVVSLRKRETLISPPFLSRINISLFLFLFILAISGTIGIEMLNDIPPIEVEMFDLDQTGRWVEILSQPVDDTLVEDPAPVLRIKQDTKQEGVNDAATQRSSLGESGKIGEKISSVNNTQGSSRRSIDDKVIQSTGIIGALTTGARSFDRIFGGGGLGAGLEKTLGSVQGITGVDQFGASGLGIRGFGPGGGGNALGIGSLGTRGRDYPGGPGAAGRYGMNQGSTGKKTSCEIAAGGGAALLMGSLDRIVVDNYIRRNLARIRACYERELQKDDSLSGKITISFIINPDGAVGISKVKKSTINNSAVDQCVAHVVKTIRFPAPKGGGIVAVTYPFMFKNTGL